MPIVNDNILPDQIILIVFLLIAKIHIPVANLHVYYKKDVLALIEHILHHKPPWIT